MNLSNIYQELFGDLPGPEYWNKKMETIKDAELKKLNNKLLKAQIRYLLKNSLFYHKKLKEAGISANSIKTIDDLEKIPFTTKNELRESMDESPPLGLHVAVPMDKIIRIHSSSGTTGKPTFQCLTNHDKEMWIELVSRALWTHGVRPGDIVAFGFSLPLFVGGLPLKDAFENIGATFLPIGTGMSERLLTLAKTLNANVLAATPSYVLYLSEFAKEKMSMDLSELRIQKIVGGAEPGLSIPAIRNKIQSEWSAGAVEGMGNADAAPIIFSECPWQNGMHFVGQGIILPELIDPESGESIEFIEGAKGELVYTTLNREATPVLRFRTGDHVTVWTEECECGRTGFRIRCMGRTDDMLKVKGVKLWPSAVRDVVASFIPKTTGNIQIIVPRNMPSFALQNLTVEVEYADEVDKKDLLKLKTEIEKALEMNLFVNIEVKLVPSGTLPRFETKAKLIRKE